MDKNRTEGTKREFSGAVKEGVGKAVGDKKTQHEGKADQTEGKAQNTFGSAKDKLRGK